MLGASGRLTPKGLLMLSQNAQYANAHRLQPPPPAERAEAKFKVSAISQIHDWPDGFAPFSRAERNPKAFVLGYLPVLTARR